MAPVSLRGYNIEIDRLIDNNQLDEAIAHCIHILTKYPKHVDTYRLLGKAFLERQRYSDAADIFLRVLAVFPDDFVAHIGISIVREEQADLNSAIYHMERAFEVQPSNTAIQDELKRLYGKRDGVTPVKIRLTHPALARLYSKGGLYQQAIGELRVALNDASTRPDILAQIADLYTKENQSSEAIDVCNQLVQRLPYCMGALNVLAKLLPGTPAAAEVPVYQARLNELDPYTAFRAAPEQDISDVNADVIMIEPLIWSPDSQLPVNKSDWAGSLGIVMVEGAQFEPATFQKKTPTTPFTGPHDIPTQPRARVSPPPNIENKPSPPEELPDWMKSAGWSHSEPGTGTLSSENVGVASTEKPPAFEPESKDSQAEPIIGEDKPQGETAPLDAIPAISAESIPDWLRPIAPTDLTGKETIDQVNKSDSPSEWVDDAFKSLFPSPSAETDPEHGMISHEADNVTPFEEVLENRLEPDAPAEITDLKPSFELPHTHSPDTNTLESSLPLSEIPASEHSTQILSSPTDRNEPGGPESSTEIPSGESTSEELDPFASLRSSFDINAEQGGENVRTPAPEENLPAESVPEELVPEYSAPEFSIPEDTNPEASVPEEKDEVVPTGTAPESTTEIPSWLLDLGETTTSGKAGTAPHPSDNDSASEELPAWLKDFDQKAEENVPAESAPFTIPPDETSGSKAPEHGAPTMILNWSTEQDNPPGDKFPTKELPAIPVQEPEISEPEASQAPDESGTDIPESIPSVFEPPVIVGSNEPNPSQESPKVPSESTTGSIFLQPEVEKEDEEEIDERPAWLAKLSGIDDIELPPLTRKEDKTVAPSPFIGIPQNIEDIPGATQAARIVDSVAGKTSSDSDASATSSVESKPLESTGEGTTHVKPGEPVVTGPEFSPSPTLISAEEITAAVTQEARPTTEAPEGEPVPDLSLIVEGLQAAWMSEQPDNTPNRPAEQVPASPAVTQPEEAEPRTGTSQVVDNTPDQGTPFVVAEPQIEDIHESSAVVPPPGPIPEKASASIPAQPPAASHKVSAEKRIPHPAVSLAEDILNDARAANTHGVIDESLDRYVELISRNRLVESVIEDLEAMAESHPDIVDIWQALGDAYTRRNKLDQALSAYKKAESLLK